MTNCTWNLRYERNPIYLSLNRLLNNDGIERFHYSTTGVPETMKSTREPVVRMSETGETTAQCVLNATIFMIGDESDVTHG